MAVKIDQRFVDSVQPDPDKVYRFYQDVSLPGYGLKVYRSGSKRYLLKYTFRGEADAVVIGDTQEMSQAQARALAEDYRYHLRQGTPPKQKVEVITVEDAIKQWYVEHEPDLKPNSRKSYRLHIDKHILPALGHKDIGEVRRDHIMKLRKSMESTPAAANQTLVVLSGFFSWATDVAEYIPTSPMKKVKHYAAKRRERALSQEETEALLDGLRQHEDQHFAEAIRLLLLTGARKSEILGARWEWVDMERGTLRLPDSKTGATTRFLAAPALKVLSRMGPKGEGAIFSLGDHQFYWQWKKLMKATGIKDLTPHDLRHNFASIAASTGHDLFMLSKLLGHASVKSTEGYAHLFVDPQKRAVEEIASEFKLDLDDSVAEVVPFRDHSLGGHGRN